MILSLFCFEIPSITQAAPSKAPEASSTLLKMHRLYIQQPPHDRSLYDVLGVSPNATAHEITKNYRRLSRKLHPDKQKGEDATKERLESVREAYEVLKDDTTRLPYHRYGLLDTADAVLLLTGKGRGDPAFGELLRLMGYTENETTKHGRQRSHKQRVWFLAAELVERVRPLVEGVVDEATMADTIIEECDRIKRLPLGANIIRCVGRAYRYSGRKVLRRYRAKKTLPVVPDVGIMDLTDGMRETFRHAKHILTAAMASGRVVVSEQLSKRPIIRDVPLIPYDCWKNELGKVSDEEDDAAPTDDDIKEMEQRKAQNAILESLQVEALWKISKVELDRTIREACDLILEGDYFFFPSHQSENPSDWNQGGDGWVGSSGIAIDAQVGRIRAAAALVMLGDIMVQRSKEGTSWME